jgi:asparagine synthase (glutamine-hydrolysing)
MCGIAGYATGRSPESAELAVRRMMAAMPRRGPDSEGLHSWPGAVFGHKRLAILDLSPGGHQPMLSEDGSIGIVFNGCIFNFHEIRTELEDLGQKFHSQCDTEVLWRGYRQWGIDVLVGRLRGMFAFAIWDHPRRRLTLVRDRLGVKPLVYAARDGEIAFASTVGALRSAGFAGEVDPQAVLEYLEFGYVTDSRSIYHGISKLPAATILEWTAAETRQRQYWKPPAIDETSRITFEEAVEETERLLVESVRLRLISDVPIGVLLSGGIDSTLVCWAMRQSGANIQAFTVRASGDPSDESAAAAETARTLGIPHQIVDMPAHDFELDEFTDAFSEPFSCSSAQAMLWVSRLVKPAATVLLTGDGGDDVFLGYPFFRNAWWAQRVARGLPSAMAPAVRGLGRLIPQRRLRRFVEYAAGGIGEHIRAHDGLPYYGAHSMLGQRLAGLSLPLRQIPPSAASGRRLVEDVFDYHLQAHFSGEFLPKVDGATMYYSLEARSPFLDQKLWEFAAALPAAVRFHDSQLKAVLREIVRRHVGPEAASRQKQGFTVPVERWLANRWSGMLDCLQGETHLEREGFVRPGSLREPVRQAIRNQWVPQQIWHLLVLEHWLEKNAAVPLRPGTATVRERPEPHPPVKSSL